MTYNSTVLDPAVLDGADTPALLDVRIDDLLLHARGLEVVRDLLTRKGASTDEVAAHTRELESTRRRLADLIRGPAAQDGCSGG
jgi:hypothetical protein